jgi:para-nitrobenzyl esterase
MTDRAPNHGRRQLIKQAAVLAGAVAAEVHLADTPVAAAAPPAVEGTRVIMLDAAIVDTSAGKVRGFSRNGVHIFRGIPYGDTTAGENRFLPPQNPKPWTGVRSSTSWGPVSPSGPRAGWRNDEEQFLELRPYDGERLASVHDVVLVSMNHRLNVFGFLDLSQIGGERYASSANAGMLDLVLALQWVRDNIAGFGGDPGNVTIFGQSGGGRKVSTLLGIPTAKGLFHKAAVLSGSHLRQILPDASTQLANSVLEVLGISKADLAKIHQVPTD